MAYNENIEKEACERHHDARLHKAQFRPDFEDAYYFCAPTRHRQMGGQSGRSATRPHDQFELMTSVAMEANEDFATMTIGTFFPKSDKWAKAQVSAALPAGLTEEEVADLEKRIEADDEVIFDAINASTLRLEMAKTFTPDVGIGTVALHIDPGPLNTIRVLGVPLTELDLNIGPDGQVDDRFWTRKTTARRLYGLVPELREAKGKKADDWRKKIADKPKGDCCVKWGWWRDWSKTEETWVWVVMIDEDLIDSGTVTGEGSCPLLVGRFGASPEWAYGQGPTLKSLPEFRSADELSALLIENIDNTIKPPMSWPSDSFINVETGVEAGRFYAIEPGQEDAVKSIYDVHSLEPGHFQLEQFERRIKRLHYIDKPEQRADTPPTATQWMSEMELGQRRFGVPGEVFWYEMPRQIYLRFRQILAKRGTIKPLQVKGQNIIISAVNPAQRAQDMQEVANGSRFVEIAGAAWPEEFKAAVDGTKSMANLREKMGVEKVIEMRDPAEVKAAVEQISKLMGGAVPGIEQSPGLLNGAPA
jgi:hypothetical protein